MGYITVEYFMQRVGKQTTSDLEVIESAISAASDWIDEKCGRTFRLTDEETRSFDSDGRIAFTDDIAEIVSVDQSYTVPKVSPGRPVSYLHTSNVGTIEVTAKFGWLEVPSLIQEATFLLANRLYNRRDSHSGVMGFSEMSAVRLPYSDPDAERLIAPYRRAVIA